MSRCRKKSCKRVNSTSSFIVKKKKRKKEKKKEEKKLKLSNFCLMLKRGER